MNSCPDSVLSEGNRGGFLVMGRRCQWRRFCAHLAGEVNNERLAVPVGIYESKD